MKCDISTSDLPDRIQKQITDTGFDINDFTIETFGQYDNGIKLWEEKSTLTLPNNEYTEMRRFCFLISNATDENKAKVEILTAHLTRTSLDGERMIERAHEAFFQEDGKFRKKELIIEDLERQMRGRERITKLYELELAKKNEQGRNIRR
ncbi:hypothetical protein [Chitinophaga niabensis]|uniref:Uncharacterized protein n=1 Tax=Chitinophaga niabensis TaxID=536979 RepID=A0A1N6KA87_9BACT|nr:hypothetical protein [Chitinophaga niabensis]SIO53514.1 hypothetical protein SAMN04488055_5429 [Chitinophaga niabensis]